MHSSSASIIGTQHPWLRLHCIRIGRTVILRKTRPHSLRLATGAYRTSPVESFHVEANEPCLDARQWLLLAIYALKIHSLPSHSCFNIVTQRRKRLLYTNKPSAVKPFCLRLEEVCQKLNIPENSVCLEKPTSYSTMEKCSLHLRLQTYKAQKEWNAEKTLYTAFLHYARNLPRLHRI